MSVLVKLPRSQSNAHHVVRGIKTLFEVLRAESGHIHCSHEYAYVLSEISDLNASPAWPRYPHEEVGGRVEAISRFRAHHYARAYGAYWGTLLNAELAAKLGGAETARLETSVAIAETLPTGGMYLQVSPSPEPATGERVTEGLKQLESFLRPVSIPIRQFFQE